MNRNCRTVLLSPQTSPLFLMSAEGQHSMKTTICKQDSGPHSTPGLPGLDLILLAPSLALPLSASSPMKRICCLLLGLSGLWWVCWSSPS